ncbi:hypothetical protein MEO94_33510, partial [Dolichospermum sp. ST_sed9]|nr:hypothetical protein [Dolichospermum sp. ST_sed9]
MLATLVNSGVKVVLSTHSPYFVRELNNLIMLNKSFDKTEEVRRRYGYESGECLNSEKVSAYLFTEKSIKQMEVDHNDAILFLQKSNKLYVFLIEMKFTNTKGYLEQLKAAKAFVEFILQKKGTGNREQIRNTYLHQFRASVKKKMFLRCVA